MVTSLYLGALKAAILIGESLGDNIQLYSELFSKSSRQIEEKLFNGEYFVQKTEWHSLRAPYPRVDDDSPNYPEFQELARKDGPPYQYGEGCLSDGVLGAWLSLMCGV